MESSSMCDNTEDDPDFDDTEDDPDFDEVEENLSCSQQDYDGSLESNSVEGDEINNQLEEQNLENADKASKRYHPMQKTKWKQNVIKGKRLSGVPYTTLKGQVKGQKIIGPPCTSASCQKSTLRSCNSISEEQREWIFTKFWSMGTWDERRV